MLQQRSELEGNLREVKLHVHFADEKIETQREWAMVKQHMVDRALSKVLTKPSFIFQLTLVENLSYLGIRDAVIEKMNLVPDFMELIFWLER